MPKLKFCVKRGWDQFFYQGSGIKLLGKMGLRDQNNGNKIGINGSRIYHVTTLTFHISKNKMGKERREANKK